MASYHHHLILQGLIRTEVRIEVANKTNPKKKKSKKTKWLEWREWREAKTKGERERYIQWNTKFQKIARRDKNTFFNEQCSIIEENNKRGKTRVLFRKTGNIKGTFHPTMGTIKDKNGRDLVGAEEIKKRWKEYTENCIKKDFNEPDYYNGVVSLPEPDILECEVKCEVKKHCC